MVLGAKIGFEVGQLVITEKDIFGLEEKLFMDPKFINKTIRYEDNILIPRHTVGIVVGFFEWIETCLIVSWSGDLKSKKLLIAPSKVITLDKFIERLDNEENIKQY